jgi:cell division protein FtsN
MAENRRDKDKRWFFTRGQLVLLGFAFTVTTVVIFFLGMIVGKGIEARKIVQTDEPLVKIPVKPSRQSSAEGSDGQAKEEITLNDSVTKAQAADSAADEKRMETPPEKAAIPDVKRSRPVAKQAVESAPKTEAKQIAKAVPPGENSKAATEQETVGSKGNVGPWTVQVNAYPDERSAKLLVDQLKNKGYNAHVTEVLNKGKTWYRVRVGRYDSKEEAKKLEDSLKSNENFAKAFTTNR